MISFYVWYLVVGLLVSVVSAAYIAKSTGVDQLKKVDGFSYSFAYATMLFCFLLLVVLVWPIYLYIVGDQLRSQT